MLLQKLSFLSSPTTTSLAFGMAAVSLLVSGCEQPKPTPKVAESKPQVQAVEPEGEGSLCSRAALRLAADKSLASLGDESIKGSELELESEESAALHEYCEKIDALRRERLDEVIAERLLKKHAAAQGKSLEQFMVDFLEESVKSPEPDELQAIYDERAGPNTPPLEEVEGELRAMIQEEREGEAVAGLVQSLRDKAKVTIQLPDVRPPAMKIDVPAGVPSWGPADAKVHIVEFSDFECPYCAGAAESLAEIKKRYAEKVRISFVHFPLPFHENAERAAIYSQCALEQGKFWEYHDALFQNQAALGEAMFVELAQAVGLKPDSLEKCLAADQAESAVSHSMETVEKLGVSATPTFFVNGRKVSPSVDELSAAIESGLKN